VELLRQLAEDGQQPLEQLAARNRWPKSSVLRCLQTLQSLGIAEQDLETRHWRALHRLQAIPAPDETCLGQAARNLPRLAEASGHCSELYRIRGAEVELVDRADPEGSEIVVQARIGSTRDLGELDATATLMYAHAGLEPPDSLWYWADGDRQPVSPRQRDRMIQRARTRGMSTDHAFNQHGIRRFAIPLFERETLTGILAVAQRLTPGYLADSERIQSALRQLSSRLQTESHDASASQALSKNTNQVEV
jgi:DNA-binding IclR family transcriptional regulator